MLCAVKSKQLGPLALMTMKADVIEAENIPSASADELATILRELLACPEDVAYTLGSQSQAAIMELPHDSRPVTYDGLVDVARFCVEEEPGWSQTDCVKLIAQYPRLDTLAPGEPRLSQLCDEYETRFPGFRLITSDEVHDPQLALGEIEHVMRNQKSKEPCTQTSPEWQAELNRLMEMLWDVSVDRAAHLRPGSVPLPEPTTAAQSTSAQTVETPYVRSAPALATDANLKRNQPPVSSHERADDEPFLSLSSFRALAVASPGLEKFFEHDLVRSFRLEDVQWSSTGGAFAWHTAPVVPRMIAGRQGPEEKSTKSSAGTTSLASALLHGNTASQDTEAPVSYSRDITTGTRGKVVGFLGGLLGEEGKTRMDALADQVALRLQTHSVRGPLPSFVEDSRGPTSEQKNSSSPWRSAWMRGRSAASNVVSDARTSGLTGRLAGVFGIQGNSSSSNNSPSVTTAFSSQNGAGEHAGQQQNASDNILTQSALRGSDLARDGPEAAVASLRAANEALVKERDTFVIDEMPASADNTMIEMDDDVDHDVEGLDALIAGDTSHANHNDETLTGLPHDRNDSSSQENAP